jgi:hypothetical protein
MAGGRPTKYTPELLEKAQAYLDGEWEKGLDGKDVIPSHVGLCLHLGVRRETLYDWAKQEDKKEFSNILENILQLQQSILISKGLSGHDKQDIATPDGMTVKHEGTVFVGVQSKD